jgi:hypothetical protein
MTITASSDEAAQGRAVSYVVRPARTGVPPSLEDDWSSDAWAGAESLQVGHFHPRSSGHRPTTDVMLAYDREGLHLIFRVQDRYVRCVHTQYQSRVTRDSAVEFFARPFEDRGYFNFEMNCGGTLLLYYIEDWNRPASGDRLFEAYTIIPPQLGELVRTRSSLPKVVLPEIESPLTWTLRVFIPFALFEHYVGPLGNLAGQEWMGNFFKCGDETSHPHWASWSPIGEKLRFHEPRFFGKLAFAST